MTVILDFVVKTVRSYHQAQLVENRKVRVIFQSGAMEILVSAQEMCMWRSFPGKSFCYNKRYNNHEKCSVIFSGVKKADFSYYMEVNNKGDYFVNCGTENTTYVICNFRNPVWEISV